MKALRVVCALAALAIFTCTANAGVLTSDDFSYPDGSLVPNGGWISHSGTPGDLLVSSGLAVVEHGSPSEDAHKMWTPTGGKLYFGIDFSVDDLGAPWAGGDSEYFAHFMGDGTFNFRGKLDIVAPTVGGDFSVGIGTLSSTADATWAADLMFGTTYRAIVMFDQDVNQAQLWIDAAVEGDTSILGADEGAPGDPMDSFGLRQSDSSENETIRVDNLFVGTTFADAVPEPATIAMLLIGGLALRRRR